MPSLSVPELGKSEYLEACIILKIKAVNCIIKWFWLMALNVLQNFKGLACYIILMNIVMKEIELFDEVKKMHQWE